MKKLILSALFATALFSAPVMAKVAPDIIKSSYGDFDAQGQLLSANPTALKAMKFKTVQKKANKGDNMAQFHLAKMYQLGIHTQKDETKAQEWYKKSAENGNAFAMNNYANYLSENEALEWFKKASDLNQPHAKMYVAMYYINSKTDIQKGVDILLELGKNGFAPAYFLLSQIATDLPADIYKNLYPDENGSLHHIKQSAEMGYSDAQVYLAQFSSMLFLFGADIDENGKKANNEISQLEKTKQNIINAYGWAKRACNNGNEQGCRALAFYDDFKDGFKDTERTEFINSSCKTETDPELKQEICQSEKLYQDLNQAFETIDKRYQ
ncbi:tetratricopeptide repeat protein [Moraxella oblonga]|uniref:tetratricopeptide repeat protein n=1 Tax=Moraxella oblonga TaxID=200413 RepID=UPI000829BA7D|nr:tetratricopeptide repeat protein [Moraxella oblonga]